MAAVIISTFTPWLFNFPFFGFPFFHSFFGFPFFHHFPLWGGGLGFGHGPW